MSLPYFYTLSIEDEALTLDEETSRHIVQVLRMDEGERLRLTDGKGNAAEATITHAHKKHCTVEVVAREFTPEASHQLAIAISLLKNGSRFEWFLEKATEMGVTEIIPLLCARTESEKFRSDRYEGICRSAMLQSQQTRLPALHQPVPFGHVVREAKHHQRFIAHCADDEKQHFITALDSLLDSHIILIGPEGDFTPDEITQAKNGGYIPVSLGNTRLRTETAGIFAAAIGSSFR